MTRVVVWVVLAALIGFKVHAAVITALAVVLALLAPVYLTERMHNLMHKAGRPPVPLWAMAAIDLGMVVWMQVQGVRWASIPFAFYALVSLVAWRAALQVVGRADAQVASAVRAEDHR